MYNCESIRVLNSKFGMLVPLRISYTGSFLLDYGTTDKHSLNNQPANRFKVIIYVLRGEEESRRGKCR